MSVFDFVIYLQLETMRLSERIHLMAFGGYYWIAMKKQVLLGLLFGPTFGLPKVSQMAGNRGAPTNASNGAVSKVPYLDIKSFLSAQKAGC